MITAQGAKQNDLLHWQNALPAAPVVHDVYAPGTGVLTHWDGETLGDCVVSLGGGRRRQDDVIDLGVGLSDIARSGSMIKRGDRIARVHANSKEQAEQIAARVADAVFFSDVDVPSAPLIYEDVRQ
jgi:thymidine phosphorylase